MVTRRTKLLLLALLPLVACSNGHQPKPSSSEQAAGVPTLGRPYAPQQQGYGEVRPRIVFNGGDPTGLLKDIEWSSWDDSRAVGQGMGFYVGDVQYVAAGHREPATVIAFDLGRCSGKLMYRKIEWFYPKYGERFDSLTYINICTGEYSRLAP